VNRSVSILGSRFGYGEDLRSLSNRSKKHSTRYWAPHEVEMVVPLAVGQIDPVMPVGAGGAVRVEVGA